MNKQQEFHAHIQDQVNALNQQIDRLTDPALVGGDRADATDQCLAGIARLSNEVKEASSSLPSYDQRSYTEAIKTLSTRLHEARAQSAPRTKFSFKSGRKTNSTIVQTNPAHPNSEHSPVTPQTGSREPIHSHTWAGFSEEKQVNPDATINSEYNTSTERATTSSAGRSATGSGSHDQQQTQESIRRPSFSHVNSATLSDLDYTHIVLPSSASSATSSRILSRLKSCVVDMSVASTRGKPFAGLTIKSIENSLLVCGHVDGPAHLTGLNHSVTVTACRQFRMHECHNCTVYLHCSSKPIIEGCSGITFAPLPECYITASDHSIHNRWNEVEDFNWLRAEANPHWRALPPEERVPESVWTDLVPESSGFGPKEILREFGLD